MENLDTNELIEQYLSGTLPPAEQRAVEARIATDAAFRADVELHRQLLRLILHLIVSVIRHTISVLFFQIALILTIGISEIRARLIILLQLHHKIIRFQPSVLSMLL